MDLHFSSEHIGGIWKHVELGKKEKEKKNRQEMISQTLPLSLIAPIFQLQKNSE